MGEQVRRSHETHEAELVDTDLPEVDKKITTEGIDAILDEIDKVLETNAVEFVQTFQQRGGQ